MIKTIAQTGNFFFFGGSAGKGSSTIGGTGKG
jgi:hypothetical protein